jgi:hypothetical protein
MQTKLWHTLLLTFMLTNFLNAAALPHEEYPRSVASRSAGHVTSAIYRLLTKAQVMDALSEGMDGVYRSYVIQAIEKVSPDRYNQVFTDTCKALIYGRYEME